MNILLACLSYREFTGSEIYFYELSSALRDAGHTVSIFSPFVSSPLKDKTFDIKFPSKDDINKEKYDSLIFSHGKVLWDYLKDVKTKKTINIIHSEVLELEEPVLSEKIDTYIGIRPSIVSMLTEKIPNKNIKLIYNPFDFSRFNIDNCKKDKKNKDKVVLFPGSLDYLRYQPLQYLLDLSVKQNFKVLHVGRNDYSTVHPNFSSQPAVWDVENYYKQCDIVSGIFLGRTSIEGLLCGKKVLQFDVDNTGKIKEVYWHTEPYLDKFSREFVANQIIDEC
jgi:glycosyltransferase involved in cell wall biosynthesis